MRLFGCQGGFRRCRAASKEVSGAGGIPEPQNDGLRALEDVCMTTLFRSRNCSVKSGLFLCLFGRVQENEEEEFPAILGCRVSRLLDQPSGQFESDQRRHYVQPPCFSTYSFLRFGEFLAPNASAGDAVSLFRQSGSSRIEWWVCYQVLVQKQKEM